jgi:hypothetical protein
MTARAEEIRSDIDHVRVRVRRERHAFRCLECESRWAARYEIRDYLGPSGDRWVVHCRDGQPVPAPNFGDPCPTCGRVSVTTDEGGAAALPREAGHGLDVAAG